MESIMLMIALIAAGTTAFAVQHFAILVDRSAGAVPVEGKPVGSLLALKVEAFEPDVCPFCAKGMPLTKPGASDKKL